MVFFEPADDYVFLYKKEERESSKRDGMYHTSEVWTVVSIVTWSYLEPTLHSRYSNWDTGWTNHGSILGTGNIFFSSSKCPNRLGGPTTLIFNDSGPA